MKNLNEQTFDQNEIYDESSVSSETFYEFRKDIEDWVKSYYEFGFEKINNYQHFKKCCIEEQIEPCIDLYKYYVKLTDMGPEEFYKKFKKRYTWDPSFEEWYGDGEEYYNEHAEEWGEKGYYDDDYLYYSSNDDYYYDDEDDEYSGFHIVDDDYDY